MLVLCASLSSRSFWRAGDAFLRTLRQRHNMLSKIGAQESHGASARTLPPPRGFDHVLPGAAARGDGGACVVSGSTASPVRSFCWAWLIPVLDRLF